MKAIIRIVVAAVPAGYSSMFGAWPGAWLPCRALKASGSSDVVEEG
jgi:hypothetical protein